MWAATRAGWRSWIVRRQHPTLREYAIIGLVLSRSTAVRRTALAHTLRSIDERSVWHSIPSRIVGHELLHALGAFRLDGQRVEGALADALDPTGSWRRADALVKAEHLALALNGRAISLTAVAAAVEAWEG